MTYDEACQWIALHKPFHWKSNEVSREEFEKDIAEAKRMSDPSTWPKNDEEKVIDTTLE
jgi:hypothetical protein